MKGLGYLILVAAVLIAAFVCSYGDNLAKQPVISQDQTKLAIGIAVSGVLFGWTLLFRAEKKEERKK